jgi:lipoprotein NlpI
VTGLTRCPYCTADVAARVPACPACAGDLSPLARVAELADREFNRGLDAARTRDWAMAREHLAVAVALDPDDTEALTLLGTVRFRHGDRDRAAEAWDAVLRREPDHAGARAARDRAVALRDGRRAPRGLR